MGRCGLVKKGQILESRDIDLTVGALIYLVAYNWIIPCSLHKFFKRVKGVNIYKTNLLRKSKTARIFPLLPWSLHFLLPLPGTLFPQITAVSIGQMSASQRGLPSASCKTDPTSMLLLFSTPFLTLVYFINTYHHPDVLWMYLFIWLSHCTRK